MTEFYLPKRERNSKRPYRLTHFQIEILQRLSNGEQLKQMVTTTRSAQCMWNMAFRIRAQMGAENSVHAVAMALREGIIK
jgi:DNA-binding CsgD family transcriptional regulator